MNIGSIISGTNPVEFQGTGITALYAANTYSGSTTISSGTLTLAQTASIANTPSITIAAGANFNVSVRSSALLLGASQILRSSATGTGSSAVVTVSSATGLTLGSTGGVVFTSYGGGSVAPLTVSGSSAGALALNSAPVTVTTTTALAAGTYKLIAKSGSATGVSGTPGALTVSGSGLAASTVGTLSVTNGELVMTVAIPPSITGSATATAFTTTYGTASTAQSFSVSGSNLTANLVATAPTGFEVSSDGTTYGSTASFAPSSGSASGTLRIRLAANAAVSGTYNSQNIVLSSTGASSVNIATASSGNAVAKATPNLSITSTNGAVRGGTVALTSSSPAASGAVPPSTGAISYSSADAGVVSIAGTTATAEGAGTVTITATQVADSNYNQATATQSFTVTAPAGTITPSTSSLSALPSTPYGTASTVSSFLVSGSSLSGNLTVSAPSGFEVSTSETGGYASSLILTATDGSVGSTTIYVRLAATTAPGNYAGNVTISGGDATTQNVAIASSSVTKADQSITFSALAAKTFGDSTFTLSATASSGLSVSYSSSNTGVATVSGNTVTVVGAGSTTITASQAGNANFNAATSVDQTLTVNKADQTITGVAATMSKVGGDAAYSLGATVSSGLTLTYASDNTGVATVSSAGLVTIVGAGTANLTVSQAGNSNYNAAPTVTQVLTVAKTAQTITFTPITTPRTTAEGPFTLAATASSGLAVTFSSSDPSVATVTGSTVTITGPGTATLTASQAGNAGFDAAPNVNQTLTVTAAPPLIAAWDFQTTSNGGTAAAAPTATPVVYVANFGSGTIYLDGSNGSSSWLVATSNTQLSAFSGASVNASSVVGMTTTTTSPASLGFVGGASNAANGKRVSFKFSMLGRKDLVVSYASQGTGSGFTSQLWEYSTDGSTWTALQTVSGIPTSFAVFTLNTITALDGDPEVYLRATFNGATASSGNNRLDNIQLRATTVPTIQTSGSLSAVNSTYGVASSATSFSLSGIFMSAGVTVEPPPGFEVSTTSDFSLNVGDSINPLVVGGAGTISSTPVYVRLKANAAPATYAGNIVLTSTGAGTVNVPTVSSTMGQASVDGTTITQNFSGVTVDDPLSAVTGWSTNDNLDPSFPSSGFTVWNGSMAARIGNGVTSTPNVEAVYQFSRGNSDKIVFVWDQEITESVAVPGVDSFGWAFRNGSTTLFSLRFLPEVLDSEPSSAWTDWNEDNNRDGVNSLVAVGFDGNGLPSDGLGLGPLDQVNFVTFERGQAVKFRVTVDLENKTWSADYWRTENGNSSWFGLVFASALPAGTTSVDRMVALWDIQNTANTDGVYEAGGSNEMFFDGLTIQGTDQNRTPVTLTLTAPTSPVYNGSAHSATASALPAVATELYYWNTSEADSTTNAPVKAGQYTAKLTVVDDATYAATPQYVTYTIAPKPVTVSSVSADNKEYDGSTSATLNTFGADIVGRVGSDDVNLAGTASGVFTDKNVGLNIPVTVTGFTLTGTAAGNYTLTQPTPNADITAKEVTVTGAVANSKTYDRTNTATINLGSATLVGVVSPDVVTVSGGGTFISSNAGPSIPVTANLSLGGANAGNYTLSQPTYLAADITARELTVPDAQAQDKSFDGTFTAVITGTLTGVLSGDTVTLVGEGQFADSNAGTNIPVASYLMLDGVSALNYSLTQPTGLTADINAQVIPVTLNPPSSFTYDSLPKEYLADSGGVMAEVSYQGKNTTIYGPSPFAPTNAGDYTVTATLSGNYSGSATEDFTIAKASQNITGVAATMSKNVGDPSYFAGGIASSGLGLSYSSSDTGVATVNASTGEVTIVAAGETTITVSQSGDTNYNAATSVTQVLTVTSAEVPYDIWIASYGYTVGVSPALRADDPDGDGMNNLTEFAFGTDPTFNTASPIEVSQISASEVRVSFLQRTDNSVSYNPRSSSDLTQSFSSWTTFTPVLAADQTNLPRTNYSRYEVLLDSANLERSFVRVEALENP